MRLDTPDGDKIELSRRSMIRTLLAAGSAPSVLAACASSVSTSADGLIEEDVRFAGAGGHQLPAYVARPSGRGRRPAIVVANEMFGVNAHIKDVCRRLAREGWVAIAPDYFDRGGDAARYEQQMDDTEGALRWLAQQRYVNQGLGIAGFGWGGALVWMACARFPQLKAGVAWYGPLVAPEAAREQRPWPVDAVANLRAPVLGLYAQNDDGIPLASIEAMRDAIATANHWRAEIILYPGAAHGFHADDRESYDAEAAADGWRRMLDWFRRHGAV